MSKKNGKCSDFLIVELSHAYMKAASSLDLLDSARARGRSGEFLQKLESAHTGDMADLEKMCRIFTQAYLTEHASHFENGEIIWKTPLDD